LELTYIVAIGKKRLQSREWTFRTSTEVVVVKVTEGFVCFLPAFIRGRWTDIRQAEYLHLRCICGKKGWERLKWFAEKQANGESMLDAKLDPESDSE